MLHIRLKLFHVFPYFYSVKAQLMNVSSFSTVLPSLRVSDSYTNIDYMLIYELNILCLVLNGRSFDIHTFHIIYCLFSLCQQWVFTPSMFIFNSLFKIGLEVLSHLDATDLCLAACVWSHLANDELLWQRFVWTIQESELFNIIFLSFKRCLGVRAV